MTLLTLFPNCQHLLPTKCEMLQGAMKQGAASELMHEGTLQGNQILLLCGQHEIRSRILMT